MTLSNRRDRPNNQTDLTKIVKSNRQSAFFFLAGTTGFLALGSLLKYSDFQSGAGLIITLSLIAAIIFGFYNFAKIIAKRNSLSRQKERVAAVLAAIPVAISIVLLFIGFII